jgi:hypothetical protein
MEEKRTKEVGVIGAVIGKAKDVFKPSNKANPNTSEENKFVHEVQSNQENAESVRGTNANLKKGIEQVWDDELKIYKGGGLQWKTSFSYRSDEASKRHPNSEDNFVFNSIENLKANICASTPEPTIEGVEGSDKEIAEKLTFMSRFNDKRNNFRSTWKKMVGDFVSYGPIIGAVLFDPDWMGGTGPNRWIGDVRVLRINKKEIFFDPAIIDLEERLQECGFVNRKFRKKLKYFSKKWPERGPFVLSDDTDNTNHDEGSDPQQATLIESWHKGTPRFMPEKFKQEFLRKAAKAEADGYIYEAQEYRDMAAGNLEGVHCAYVANGVFLEYIPYIYEDGLYPFVYKVCYYDENSPFGFGEIRNIKIPQVLHNKADELELEAACVEGLGGGFYKKDTITDQQMKKIVDNNGKPGMWFPVNDIHQIKEREGAKVPGNITAYKEHKQRMIETISNVTPIQQGMSPGANVPYSTIRELGARTDTRIKQKVEILEDFLIELNQLRINRFKQFYEEDRYYRLKMPNGGYQTGTLNRDEIMQTWDREQIQDEEGNIIGAEKERYVPEFDVNVKIMDEKPTDRNYYTSTAFQLLGVQGMTIDDVWYTLEEGKFPQKDEVLEHLRNQNIAMQITNTLNQMPPEAQQAFFNAMNQLAQNVLSQVQAPVQGGVPPNGM